MRMLIVDDSPLICRQISEIISSMEMNWEIWTANNGEEAIELIDKDDIDIVFLDIVLPGISGSEVLKFIRAYDKVSKGVCNDNQISMENVIENCKKISELKKQLKFDFMIEDIDQLLSETMDGLRRVAHIVQTLKKFARSGLDGARCYFCV